jgi:hypothetical protein
MQHAGELRVEVTAMQLVPILATAGEDALDVERLIESLIGPHGVCTSRCPTRVSRTLTDRYPPERIGWLMVQSDIQPVNITVY